MVYTHVLSRGGRGHSPLDRPRKPVSGETRRIGRGGRSAKGREVATCQAFTPTAFVGASGLRPTAAAVYADRSRQELGTRPFADGGVAREDIPES